MENVGVKCELALELFKPFPLRPQYLCHSTRLKVMHLYDFSFSLSIFLITSGSLGKAFSDIYHAHQSH